MSEQETPQLDERVLAGINEQLETLFSGKSAGVVLITFGPSGKTTLAGDVAQIVLALETAKTLVIQDAIQRSALAQQSHVLYSTPTAGNA